MKRNNFRGELTDISAKKEALTQSLAVGTGLSGRCGQLLLSPYLWSTGFSSSSGIDGVMATTTSINLLKC